MVCFVHHRLSQFILSNLCSYQIFAASPTLQGTECAMYCAGHRGKFFAHSCLQTFCCGSALQLVNGTRVTNMVLMVTSSSFC